ncbi:MAG: hypothetical protein ACLUEQ_06910 [Cloacibacillus evryensis]
MVAADPRWQEAGFWRVISALMRPRGRPLSPFVYTKPEMAERFAGLGFRELAAPAAPC